MKPAEDQTKGGGGHPAGATYISPVERSRPYAGGMDAAPARNIVVLLTAPLPAAISVVRLNGPAVAAFAAAHLSKPPKIGRCVHCDFRDGDEIIDDVVAVLITCDRLDLNLHGGPWVAEATLRLAARTGFDVVSWQDAGAVATDAASDIEAEVAAALPFAHTREALAILLAQPSAWATMLAVNDHGARMRALADQTIQFILMPPSIAIVGEPNAGKSTLVNHLAGQARSIVADVPGTTRDYVSTPANLNGLIVNLLDTPGFRETNDPIEAAAIARAKSIIQSADIVVELRDATRPRMPITGIRSPMIVWNKCDLAASATGGLAISAETGVGMEAFITALIARLPIGDLQSLHVRCWTERQKRQLQ